MPKITLLGRYLACAAALSLCGIMGWMAVRHGMAAHWSDSQELSQWQRAADWEPDNPERWYRLGRYYQIDFEHADLSRAVSYYSRAAAMAPGSAEYWLNLAEAEETARHPGEAERAFRQASQAYPMSADVAWRFGNFLLRQNRQEEAYREIHKALSVKPSLTSLAISRCWQSTRDIEQILKLALPAEADAYWGALDFLVDAREADAAMVVWKRLIAGNPKFELKRAFRLEDMLIEASRAGDARTVWRESLAATEPSDGPQDESAVWNGSFEQDLMNGGLGWRFRRAPGAELSFDSHVARGEGRSLQIVFDGTSNVDFEQPWQYVVLEPNTRYRLSAYFRTEKLHTSSPVRLELEELHFGAPMAQTSELPETQAWAPSETEITSGAEKRLLRLVLRRRPSPKLDNKISGTIWMDEVALVPVMESSGLQ